MKRTPQEQAKIEATFTALFETALPFNKLLGLQLLSFAPPQLRLVMKPELVGHPMSGRLHGGVISATLDTMGGLALAVAITHKHADESAEQLVLRFAKVGTIDLRVDYLRQGIGMHFVASAEVMRLGGRVGTTQMKLVNNEGTLIAIGSAAYVLA